MGYFFFQAEDGIRDMGVTGVQTCALPIFRITFHPLDGKQVCRLIAEPAPRPVWVKEGAEEHLYIRSGNSTRRLSTREAQIGRASCRERVQISVSAVSL